MAEAEKAATRVLLVDDEQDLVDFLAKRLVKRGYVVRATTNGEDAVAAATQQTFDVAVVDLKMPVMDGIAVIKKIRAQQPFLQTIMLTGHGSHDSALEAGKLQTHRYLLKPYDFDKLVERIDEACAARRETMREEFTRRMNELTRRNVSARQITSEAERLRREYEQE
jgi:DNA-binding NtrC family response regulator